MNSETAGGAPPGPEIPRAAEGERRVRDRRSPWRVWIPTYIVTHFGNQLGAYGQSLYMTLAWHVTREARNRWPSLNDLAEMIGCSRSTIERTMRLLRSLELIETTPCIDSKGQHSNYFTLIDPPAFRETQEETGTEVAGPVSPTGGRRLPDGAPPAVGQGGAVSQTAPSGDPELEKEECAEGGARASSPPVLSGEACEQLGSLVDLWMHQLALKRRTVREAQALEIGAEVAELLRRGFSAEELRKAMNDPDRRRQEWPREWRERVESVAKAIKTPTDPAEVAHKRAQAAREAQEAAQHRAAVFGTAGLAELAKRRRNGTTEQPSTGPDKPPG
jgi:hypothetical protein